MTAVSVWTDEGLRTMAKARHHVWYADEPADDGGTDSAPSPTEMLLGSLGSCMVITVELYAHRKNWPLEKVEINLELQRYNAADYPAYKGGDAQFVHEIREQVIIHGSQLSDEQRKRLLEIAGKCPVRRVLINPVFFVEFQPQKA
jgi:putative redox protein